MSLATLAPDQRNFERDPSWDAGERVSVTPETANATPNPANTAGEFHIPDTEPQLSAIPMRVPIAPEAAITHGGRMGVAIETIERAKEIEALHLLEIARASGAVTEVRLRYYESEPNNQ